MPAISSAVIPGPREARDPESILLVVVMDSGFARSLAPRNDGGGSRASFVVRCVPPRLRAERGGELPQPPGQDRGAVPGRRADRHQRPHHRAEAVGGLGPGRGDREPPRRQHRHRRVAGREVARRRLHAARRDGHHAGDEPGVGRQHELRPVQGLRADHDHREEHVAAHGARDDGPKIDQGADRARQSSGKKLTYGAGITITRLAGLEFAKAAGIEVVLVPYKGSSEVVQGLLTGSVDFIVDGMAASLPLIQAGKLRAAGEAQQPPSRRRCRTCSRCRSQPACRRFRKCRAGSAWSRPPARRRKSWRKSTMAW